jgi:phosphatidylserine/phosphatidylglycerophosphate/cardiolipin synthase-like enzyme
MNFSTKASWAFLVAALIVSVGIIDYAKHDSFFGIYSFETGRFDDSLQSLYAAEVYFCPEDACADKLIRNIDNADESVNVAIYSLSNDSISDALIRAHERGVNVRVVFDYYQSIADYSDDEKLIDAGINILRKKGSGAMHNKFTIIDESIVLTGSFNYSANADERNDENLFLIEDDRIAKEYLAEFEELVLESQNEEEKITDEE